MLALPESMICWVPEFRTPPWPSIGSCTRSCFCKLSELMHARLHFSQKQLCKAELSQMWYRAPEKFPGPRIDGYHQSGHKSSWIIPKKPVSRGKHQQQTSSYIAWFERYYNTREYNGDVAQSQIPSDSLVDAALHSVLLSHRNCVLFMA